MSSNNSSEYGYLFSLFRSLRWNIPETMTERPSTETMPSPHGETDQREDASASADNLKEPDIRDADECSEEHSDALTSPELAHTTNTEVAKSQESASEGSEYTGINDTTSSLDPGPDSNQSSSPLRQELFLPDIIVQRQMAADLDAYDEKCSHTGSYDATDLEPDYLQSYYFSLEQNFPLLLPESHELGQDVEAYEDSVLGYNNISAYGLTSIDYFAAMPFFLASKEEFSHASNEDTTNINQTIQTESSEPLPSEPPTSILQIQVPQAAKTSLPGSSFEYGFDNQVPKIASGSHPRKRVLQDHNTDTPQFEGRKVNLAEATGENVQPPKQTGTLSNGRVQNSNTNNLLDSASLNDKSSEAREVLGDEECTLPSSSRQARFTSDAGAGIATIAPWRVKKRSAEDEVHEVAVSSSGERSDAQNSIQCSSGIDQTQERVVCLYDSCSGATIDIQDAFDHYSDHLKRIRPIIDRKCPHPECTFGPQKSNTARNVNRYADHIIYQHHSIGYRCSNECGAAPFSRESLEKDHQQKCVGSPKCCQSYDDKGKRVAHTAECSSTTRMARRRFARVPPKVSKTKRAKDMSSNASKRRRIVDSD